MIAALLNKAKAVPPNAVIPKESYWLPIGKILSE